MNLIKLIFLVILFLNVNSKANSFEISGLNLGDNLLDILTLNYINKNTAKNYYSHLKDPYRFTTVIVKDHPQINSKYNVVDVTFKIENNKFIVIDISAGEFYFDNIKDCYKDLFVLSEYVQDKFPNSTITPYHMYHTADPSGKSTISGMSLIENEIIISIECYDWTDQMKELNNWTDHLSINYGTWEFQEWLSEKNN